MEKVSRVAGDMQPQKAPNPQKAPRFWESGCRFQDSGCRFQESGCVVSPDPHIFSMSVPTYSIMDKNVFSRKSGLLIFYYFYQDKI